LAIFLVACTRILFFVDIHVHYFLPTLNTTHLNVRQTEITIVIGRRPLGRPRRRWEDNIKMDLREIGFGDCGLDLLGSG
jgi:hypothetical protein